MEEKKKYKPLVSFAKAAKHLDCSVETLRKKAARGEIETHKLWGKRLISEEEIIRLIEQSRERARGKTRPQVTSLTTNTRGRGRT